MLSQKYSSCLRTSEMQSAGRTEVTFFQALKRSPDIRWTRTAFLTAALPMAKAEVTELSPKAPAKQEGA